jgi:glycosyltransferase involved in cell wall biosynthesis
MQRFRPQQRPDRAPVIVGTAARLSVEKGLDDLIGAFAIVHREVGAAVRLRIAGDGPERARLERLASDAGIGAEVEILGWLPHDDLPAFLQGLDVFVLPSVYEGFGVAAVEASATGLPVVASNVYGIPDVVRHGETGLLTPARDPEALAAAIRRLVDSAELRASLGSAGRSYVAARYDWRENTATMERLYQELSDTSTTAVRS